jgi:hypothetical protein
MPNQSNVHSTSGSRTIFRQLKARLAKAAGSGRGALLAGALTLGAGLAYSDDAAAAQTWGNCQAYIIYEIGTRNFQVTCGAGSDTVWMMYLAPDDATAQRFQSLVTAAILSGKYVRALLDTTHNGLCTGVGQTCRRAVYWSLSTTPTP